MLKYRFIQQSISVLKSIYRQILSKFLYKVGTVSLIRLIGYAISFALVTIIARNYGSEQLGVYHFCLQLVSVLTYLTLLGWGQSSVKFVPKFNSAHYKIYYKSWYYLCMTTVVIVALFISGVLFLTQNILAQFFQNIENLNEIIYAVMFVLPLVSISFFIIELLKSQQKVILSEVCRSIFQKSIFLGLMISPMSFFSKNIVANNLFLSMSFAFMIIFGMFVVISVIMPKQRFVIDGKLLKLYRSSASQSIVMFQSGFLVLLSNNGLILLLAYFLSLSELGIVGVSIQLIALNSFLYGSVVIVAAPKLAQLYSKSQEKHIFELFLKKVLIFNFFSSSFITFIILLSLPFYLHYLGSEFSENIKCFYLFICTSYFTSISGPSGALMDIVGLHRVKRNLAFISLFAVIIFLFLLAPSYGLMGATLSICLPKIFSNTLSIFLLYHHSGILSVPLYKK